MVSPLSVVCEWCRAWNTRVSEHGPTIRATAVLAYWREAQLRLWVLASSCTGRKVSLPLSWAFCRYRCHVAARFVLCACSAWVLKSFISSGEVSCFVSNMPGMCEIIAIWAICRVIQVVFRTFAFWLG